MSIQTQKKNMREIAELLSQDLSYIHGERDGGPNGAKKQFLTKSAAFLRALGKDLGCTEMKVHTNPAGIAVSGDVTLYGMWSEDSGIMFTLTECLAPADLPYRSIRHIRDYHGGPISFLPLSIFKLGRYEYLCETLLKLRKSEVCHVRGGAA